MGSLTSLSLTTLRCSFDHLSLSLSRYSSLTGVAFPFFPYFFFWGVISAMIVNVLNTRDLAITGEKRSQNLVRPIMSSTQSNRHKRIEKKKNRIEKRMICIRRNLWCWDSTCRSRLNLPFSSLWPTHDRSCAQIKSDPSCRSVPLNRLWSVAFSTVWPRPDQVIKGRVCLCMQEHLRCLRMEVQQRRIKEKETRWDRILIASDVSEI